MAVWKLHGNGKDIAPDAIVLPEERLGWVRTLGFGAQHVVAMFGATFLVPIITGFSPTATLFFSGLGTILFLLITGNRLPSYLGSSFAFIAPIAVATGVQGDLGAASFGILMTGLLLFVAGLLVHFLGISWINTLMPPVVMGAIVALIGFNLAPVVRDNFSQSPVIALVTIISVLLVTVLFRGILGRLSIVLGVIVGYFVALFTGNVDTVAIEQAAWFGLPEFHAVSNPLDNPALWGLLPSFLPVVLVLVAENVGHVKSVGLMMARDTDPLMGRALVADGVATVFAGFGGGSGTTTYGENIGVMAATRVFSTAAYWVAALFAIFLSFSPKVGAVINSIPAGVLGGVTVALYGLIGLIGIKIWIDNRVDFNLPINQFTAAVALIVGIANFLIDTGTLLFNGIALGTVAAVAVYHFMRAVQKVRCREQRVVKY
ncbi:nitrate reductase [Canibacter sp. lx-72]|uniref:uracil-xanthine permease family protein n=1 Tax=Canibacter zhuwentaonis TaxID=2837491 RepID=UPI001BDC605E|nr:solute carrier family 23 protein [Canibacter zhuwentaonis]MBT1018039.1 nitrate reductase [Canibacter zhuwentaonis]